MDNRSFQSGAAASAPAAPASPSSGYPTNGNPSTGTPATLPGAYWFHQIGEEIRNVIAAAGLTPNNTTLNQLSTAITDLIASSAVSFASAAEAQAQTINTKAITPLRLSDAFKSGNQSLAAGGYQKLPGGLIVQWMQAVESADSSSSINFPIAFPNAVLAILGNPISTAASMPAGLVVHSYTTSSLIFHYGDSFGNGTNGFVVAIGY